LLLHKVVGLSLELCVHLPPDVVHLLLLGDSGIVLALKQYQILGQLITALLLLDQALVLLLEHEVELLFLCEATDREVTSATLSL